MLFDDLDVRQAELAAAAAPRRRDSCHGPATRRDHAAVGADDDELHRRGFIDLMTHDAETLRAPGAANATECDGTAFRRERQLERAHRDVAIVEHDRPAVLLYA